jgi:acyl-CoA synthetase (AMP-forming)/AMP-acid ligase II
MKLYRNPFFAALENLESNALVFSDGKKRVSAGEIHANALATACGLKNQGFHEGDRAVLIIPPGREFLEVFFAIGLLKGIIAIVDPEMGRENFESKLKQLNPQWIFIDSRLVLLREHPIIRFFYLQFSKKPFYVSLSGKAKIVTTGKRLPLLSNDFHLSKIRSEIELTEYGSADNHDLVITYTSGTLAEPKGVVHSVNSLFESLSHIKTQIDSNPETRIGAYLPHFLLIGICSGSPVYLFPKEQSAEWKFNFFTAQKITTLFGPPSDYLPLIQFCKQNNCKLPKSISLVMLGSAPVYPNFLEELISVCDAHVEIKCMYGMTENLVVAIADGRVKVVSETKGDFLGKPVKSVELSLADDGEVMVNSPQLFSRYLNLDSRETPHHTGDLGYIENGALVLTGRKKEMIIRRDTNIYPAIYEKTIRGIPGVSDAVMIGNYRNDLHDEEVVLFVESDFSDQKMMMSFLSEGKYSIDKEALPDKIVFTKIPRSGRQDKVDRKALKTLLS